MLSVRASIKAFYNASSFKKRIQCILLQNTGTVIISQERMWLTVSVMHRTPKGNGPGITPGSFSGICQNGMQTFQAIFRFLSTFLVTQQTVKASQLQQLGMADVLE